MAVIYHLKNKIRKPKTITAAIARATKRKMYGHGNCT